jgi:hypothetical protein
LRARREERQYRVRRWNEGEESKEKAKNQNHHTILFFSSRLYVIPLVYVEAIQYPQMFGIRVFKSEERGKKREWRGELEE